VVERVAAELAGARDAFATAHRAADQTASGAWLPGPASDRLDTLSGRLDDALWDADTALAAAEVAPALLGADGARSWFLAVHTPVEQRGGGGFMGNWGELVSEGGGLSLERMERIRTLTAQQQDTEVSLDPEVAQHLTRYAGVDITRFFQNALQSPDFAVNAQAIEEVAPQLGAPAVAGVVAVDPIGLAALLEVTGPVSIPLWPEPITADNAREVLLFEQYLHFDDRDDRVDFLGDVAEAVIDELTSGEVGSPADLARALAPAVAGKHLVFHSPRPEEQAVFERAGAAGRVPPAEGDDYLQVMTYNTSISKIDWFLRREVAYEVRFDADDGWTESTLDVRLHNDAPSEGLPPYVINPPDRPDFPGPGENRTLVSIYSPLELQGATLEGMPLEMDADAELGRWVYSALVTIPSQSALSLRLELAGALAPGPDYRLQVGLQPQSTPDQLRVEAAPADGATTPEELFEGPQPSDLVFDTGLTHW
jgi:hypothetical protein